MADTNILLLNQMYGIATVQYQNKNNDSKNRQNIDLSQEQFDLNIQTGTGKEQILYGESQTQNPVYISNPNSTYAKFIGYVSEDCPTSSLQKKAGYYWITEQSRSVIFFTGVQFIKYENNSGTIKQYALLNSGTKQQPIPVYPSNLGYQMIKASVEMKSILRITFNGDVYQLGNIKQNSLQFSFNDQDYYKQLRFLDQTQEYRIDYYQRSHSNYIEID